MLTFEQHNRAIDAIQTLYWLGLIDEFTCQELIIKVNKNTGE